MKRSKLKESRAKSFDRVETEDARRQLGISALDLKQEDWKPTQVEHALEDRKRIAQLLCKPLFDLIPQGKLRYRMEMIEAFISLCRRKEIPQKRRPVQERNWAFRQPQNQLPSPALSAAWLLHALRTDSAYSAYSASVR